MSVNHYENFPVASILLPRRLRTAVHNLYRFARSADDIADEGDALPSMRLAQLADYRDALDAIAADRLCLPAGDARKPIFDPLQTTIRQHKLPLEPFFDLLNAFEQDVVVTRYETDAQLFDYCRRSANPVGRLMLHLYKAVDTPNLAASDAICTGLQLTNFWQDIAIDWQKGRLYLPRRVLERHGVTEAYIANRVTDATPERQASTMRRLQIPAEDGARAEQAWLSMMREQVQQARSLLNSGLPLANRLPGRFGLELKLIVHGGLRILERLDQLHYDIFQQRPKLAKSDWVVLFWRAVV